MSLTQMLKYYYSFTLISLKNSTFSYTDAKITTPYNKNHCLRSVAGLVIQATGRTEFEDGLRPGSPGGVLSDNPSVRTSSLVTPVL